MKNSGQGRKIDVYFDGQCPMCSDIMQRVRESDKSRTFRLHDMHRTERLPVDRQAIEKEIHVVDSVGALRKGPDAILFLAEQFPRLRGLARAARVPALWAFAPAVYRFVAANRRFLVGPAARLYWLKVAAIVTLCIELAMSPRLWIGPRTYPLAPVLDAMPSLPGAAGLALYAGFFLAAAGALVFSRPQRWIAAMLGILLAFCLFDQTRWQPWLLMLGALLVPLAFFSWKPDDVAGRDKALNIARLIIAATYIYAGLQKANVNFVDRDFPWIVSPITDHLPAASAALRILGVAVPFVQFSFGLGLLFPRSRRVALFVAVSMHVFILLMFGPLGLDWNTIVWPWTASMALFDLLLFSGDNRTSASDILFPGRDWLHAAAVVLFAVMPALSFFNLWDSYPSAAIYSGNLTDGTIYVSDAGRSGMAPSVARWLVHSSANTNVINLQRWTVEELGVSDYAETRIYEEVARDICADMKDPSQLVLEVRENRAFFSNPEADYRCSDLRVRK